MHEHRWKQAAYNTWYCDVQGCGETREYGGRPAPAQRPQEKWGVHP